MGRPGVAVDVFANLLQGRHPAHRQVAVLQDHPVTCLEGLLNLFSGSLTLTLAKRDRIGPLVLAVCELQQGLKWVRSWREHEDQWRGSARLEEDIG